MHIIMSRTTKRKHVVNELLTTDLRVPASGQMIVRVVASRGNNLHEVESPDGEKFLVSMPPKFRRNVWIKRGNYLIAEPIAEGDKVRAEMVQAVTPDFIRYLKNEGVWPAIFTAETKKAMSFSQCQESSRSSSDDED